MSDNKPEIIPNEIIEKKIYIIRGQKVMLDKDLASLYSVMPIRLREQVKRNIKRFPDDFMFQLTKEETHIMVSQIAIPSFKYFGGTLPYVFTEQGVSMLSSILNSDRAIQVNIQIMRTFTKLREMLLNNKELKEKIEQLERKYDGQFKNVFDAIRLLIDKTARIERRITTEETKPKKKYGFV